MSLTLLEALQSDEAKAVIASLVEAELEESLESAVEARVQEMLPTLQESVRESVREEEQAKRSRSTLADKARELIEASKLPKTAQKNLIDDYSIVNDREGRGLSLVEAVMDGDEIKTSEEDALVSQVEADVKRKRDELSEAAPTRTFAPSTADPAEAAASGEFLGEQSSTAKFLKEKGLDPTQFGAKAPEPATT